MTGDGDLVEKILATLACEKGVAIARDDPLIEVVLLNQALLEHYLARAVAPIKEAIAGAVTQAKKEMGEDAQAQVRYIEEVGLKDRERFVAEQKAALDGLDKRLEDRDVSLVKLMTGILEKARKQLGNQSTHVPPKWTGIASMILGIAIGATGSLGGMWLMFQYG